MYILYNTDYSHNKHSTKFSHYNPVPSRYAPLHSILSKDVMTHAY
jgi:hypothetical protein